MFEPLSGEEIDQLRNISVFRDPVTVHRLIATVDALKGVMEETLELLSSRDKNGFPPWLSASEELLSDTLINQKTSSNA